MTDEPDDRFDALLDAMLTKPSPMASREVQETEQDDLKEGEGD